MARQSEASHLHHETNPVTAKEEQRRKSTSMASFGDRGGGVKGSADSVTGVFIGSFNINSQDLSSEAARAWLKEAEGADIVALGLQVTYNKNLVCGVSQCGCRHRCLHNHSPRCGGSLLMWCVKGASHVSASFCSRHGIWGVWVIPNSQRHCVCGKTGHRVRLSDQSSAALVQ